MAISYQKLFQLLEEKGWTTYKIRKEKLIGQGTLTALKNGTGGLDSKTISRLCEVLNCQPGDLMEYVPSQLDQSSLSSQHPQRQEPAATMTREPIPANGPSARIQEAKDAEDLSGSSAHRYETLEEKLARMREAHVSRKD